MCLNNPFLVQALARDRVAELRQCARATAHVRPTKPGRRLTDTARRRVGWLLVDLGLRLAAPRAS
jgi:hypothetical protein